MIKYCITCVFISLLFTGSSGIKESSKTYIEEGFLFKVYGRNDRIKESVTFYLFLNAKYLEGIKVSETTSLDRDSILVSSIYNNSGFLVANEHNAELLYLCNTYDTLDNGISNIITGKDSIPSSVKDSNSVLMDITNDKILSIFQNHRSFEYYNVKGEEITSVKITKVLIEYSTCICLNINYSSFFTPNHDNILMLSKIIDTEKLNRKEIRLIKEFLRSVYNYTGN